MPPHPLVPDAFRTIPFRGSEAVRSGVLTRRQLRGDTWRRLLHDVYVHRDVLVSHELKVRAATTLLMDAVVTGRSAAVLWGIDLARTDDPVELTVSPGTHQVRVEGLVVRRALLDPGLVRRRHGVPVTAPAATAVRLASVLPRDSAVAAVDQLVTAGVVGLDAVRELAAGARGPGSAHAQDVAALADGLAESPQETRVRLLIGRVASRRPSPGTGCSTGTASWPGSTSPGRSAGWPWSTTGCGTAAPASSSATGNGSTGSARRDGRSCS